MTTVHVQQLFPASFHLAERFDLSFSTIPTAEQVGNALVDSLSGSLDEYNKDARISADGVPLLVVTAKDAYRERFRNERARFHSLEAQMAILLREQARRDEEISRRDGERARRDEEQVRQEQERVRQEQERVRQEQERYRFHHERVAAQEDEQARRDQVQEYNEEIVLEYEIFVKLGRVLQTFWFPQLRRSVRLSLKSGGQVNLPRLFASWWLIWNQIDSVSFALPNTLCRLQDLPADAQQEVGDVSLLLAHDNCETSFGKTVSTAWDSIPSADRELMLFCWRAKQEKCVVRNHISNPKPSTKLATDVLRSALVGNLECLQERAAYFVDISPEAFGRD